MARLRLAFILQCLLLRNRYGSRNSSKAPGIRVKQAEDHRAKLLPQAEADIQRLSFSRTLDELGAVKGVEDAVCAGVC